MGQEIKQPIFILGPERTGTTLLYSILANSRECYWLSRIDSLLPSQPYISQHIRKFFSLLDTKSFVARAGQVSKMSGVNTPSECLPYWHKIFQWGDEDDYRVEDDYFSQDDATEELAESIRQDLLVRLTYSNKKRLLFKQPGFSLKLSFWNHIFPDALFLICVRDIGDNIRSYIRVKEKSDEAFWGTKVPGWQQFRDCDLSAQTAYQLREIYSCIITSLNDGGNSLKNKVKLIPFSAQILETNKTIREVVGFCSLPITNNILTATGNVRKREVSRDLLNRVFQDKMEMLEYCRQQADDCLKSFRPEDA